MSKFILAQIGTPRHYAVAKILFANSMLHKMIVDAYFSKENFLAKLPVAGKIISNKLKSYDAGINAEFVLHENIAALYMRLLLKYSGKTNAFDFANKRLTKRVINYSKKISAENFYGFDTSSKEFLEWSAGKGWNTFVEQCVAPRNAQIEMWQTFQEKYNMNNAAMIEHAKYQHEREASEWQLANHLIVPSDYVKKELIKTGEIPENKIHIVHYGYDNIFRKEMLMEKIKNRFEEKNKQIKILFAGNAGYRKGIADIVEIAAQTKNENLHYYIAGKLETEAELLLKNYKYRNITVLGKLSHAELSEKYMSADIFFFPSYLEGSALVLTEAMSYGLPVVTTHQSGSAVQQSFNGFITNAGDLEILKKYILRLSSDEALRYDMSINSMELSQQYTLEKYSENLLKILTAN